jgi:hypothetical protein
MEPRFCYCLGRYIPACHMGVSGSMSGGFIYDLTETELEYIFSQFLQFSPADDHSTLALYSHIMAPLRVP